MRDIISAGARLLLIALIAALLLAGTNMITRGPIAQAQFLQVEESRLLVMPEADAFKPVQWPGTIELTSFPSLIQAHEAYRGGELIGYVFLYQPMGYKGEIPVSVGIRIPPNHDEPGVITGISIGAITETTGLGSRIKDDAFKSQFNDLPTDKADTGVNTISGATISSGAVKRAVLNAVQAYDALRP